MVRMADFPDEIVLEWLINEKGFSHNGARTCLENFRSSMMFAGIDTTTEYERQRRFEAVVRRVRANQ